MDVSVEMMADYRNRISKTYKPEMESAFIATRDYALDDVVSRKDSLDRINGTA